MDNFDVRAELLMTPMQFAMSEARAEVLTHLPDFIAAGVSEDHVKLAARNASDRVQADFEERQVEDVFNLVSQLLQNCASNYPERELAYDAALRMEDARVAWRTAFQAEAEINEGVSSASETIQNLLGWGIFPTSINIWDSSTPQDFCVDYRPAFTIVHPVKDEFVGYLERVLRALNVLKKEQTLDVLRSLPIAESGTLASDRGERRHFKVGKSDWVDRLSTNIDGLSVTVGLPQNALYLRLEIESSVMQRIVGFPSA